jgi:putative transposase
MSRFRKLAQTIWYCQYHIVWVPKYRFRVLTGKIAEEVENCIRAFSEQQGCEVVELNVQADHVHLLALVPPKVAISGYVGTLKGRTAIRIFNRFRKLKEKPYWGNHFWARGVLRGYGRPGSRNDPQIHKVSRGRGAAVRDAKILA